MTTTTTTTTAPLQAETMELRPGLLKACKDEKAMFCKDVVPGSARLFRWVDTAVTQRTMEWACADVEATFFKVTVSGSALAQVGRQSRKGSEGWVLGGSTRLYRWDRAAAAAATVELERQGCSNSCSSWNEGKAVAPGNASLPWWLHGPSAHLLHRCLAKQVAGADNGL